MTIDLNKIPTIKDGREQLLVFQFTKENVDGVFYGCKINFEGLERWYEHDVSGAITAIVESYSNILPESKQIEFEKSLLKNLIAKISSRYDKIQNIYE